MKETFRKLFSYLMVFVMMIANPVTAIVVNAEGEKEAVDSVTVGDLNGVGHIQVKKSVTPTENLGEYTVTFNVKSVAEQKTIPVYATVVFDRSGSMICKPSSGEANYAWTGLVWTAADGANIKCGVLLPHFSDFTEDKWESAIAGAQTFKNTISNAMGENAHVSLITFSSDYSRLGAVSAPTTDFSKESFGHPIGGTELDKAINAATAKLNEDAKNTPNAKKVMLIISDGDPDDKDAATAAANTAKNSENNIEIYAVGYETNDTTSSFLKGIATNADHYSSADAGSVGIKVEQMANELMSLNGAEIVETPNSPAFKLQNGEEASKKLEIESIDQATKVITYKPITYTIKIDETLESDVYETNDINNTKIVLGEEEIFSINASPSVSWERPSYNYTVNYYKDSVSAENKIEEKTQNGTDELTKEIPYDKNITDIKGYVFDHAENSAGEEIETATITNDNNANVVNVVYKKNDELKYNVYYQYQNLDGETYTEVNPNIEVKATFGDVISSEVAESYVSGGEREGFTYNRYAQSPEAIDDKGANRLDIIYTRNKYNYCVNYYYDGEKDEEVSTSGNDYFGKTISYEDKDRDGYRLENRVLPVPTANEQTIRVTADNTNPVENTIEYYYVKDNFNYTVEYYFDDELEEIREYEATYEDIIEEYEEMTKDGYELDRVENLPLEISYNVEDNVIKVYYVSVEKEEAIAIPNTGI